MSETKTVSTGIGTYNTLGIAFVILKLCGVIDWSWLWVLAPFWIPWTIIGVVALFVLVGMGGAIWLDHRNAKRRRKYRRNLG